MKSRLHVNSMDQLKSKAMQEEEEKPKRKEEVKDDIELAKGPDPPSE